MIHDRESYEEFRDSLFLLGSKLKAAAKWLVNFFAGTRRSRS